MSARQSTITPVSPQSPPAPQSPAGPPQAVPPGPIQAGINVDPAATPDFRARVNACLAEYWSLGPTSMQLVRDLNSAKAYILIRPASASPKEENGTLLMQPEPDNVPRIVVFWNPNDTRPYKLDNIPRVPCGTLIHELKHVDDLLHGVIHDLKRDEKIAEPRAVQLENLYYWRRGLPQRHYYYPWPDPLPKWVLWGIAQMDTPRNETGPEPSPSSPAGTSLLTLTVMNETPELILITGRKSGRAAPRGAKSLLSGALEGTEVLDEGAEHPEPQSLRGAARDAGRLLPLGRSEIPARRPRSVVG